MALIQRSLALGSTTSIPRRCTASARARRATAKPCAASLASGYVLSTKVGRVLQPPAPGSAKATWAFDFSARGVRESFKASLARLGLERVDIVFVHDPDDHYEQALKEAFPVLVELRAAGRGPGHRRRDEPVADGAGVRPGGPLRLLPARRALHAPGPDRALRVPAVLPGARDRGRRGRSVQQRHPRGGRPCRRHVQLPRRPRQR